MSNVTLSSALRAKPHLVSSSLEKMSCNAQGIAVIDIYPSVLSALVAKGAPDSVAKSARAFMQVARCTQRAQRPSDECNRDRALHGEVMSLSHTATTAPGSDSNSGRSISKEKKRADNDDSYMSCFNVGIAMSLHTILLSRNRISSLLGIVQFKHCVSLSLLGNHIRTIEKCEPLAMLPDLQYLSLEYNPVAQLPHYRAHMLRICSWPQELSPNTCRLRKLDSTPVTTTEVKRAVLCLRCESALMPELLYRMQLLAFLVDIENRQRLHHELRQRGHVLQDLNEHTKMELLLERGVAHALSRIEVAGAAHLARQLVRDGRFRPTTSSSRSPHSTGQPSGATITRRDTHRSATNTKGVCEAVDEKGESAADVTSTTITHFGSDILDQSDITSTSTVSSGSLFTNTRPDHADVLQSLSHLLGSTELDWSRRSLRRADASHAADTCKVWSKDAFRQTIALLDVRLCTLFLRISRAMGQTLTSHDVDRLCEVWLHAVLHCTPAEAEEVNVTGSRRSIVKFGAAVAGRQTAKRSAAANQVTITQQECIPNTTVTGRIPVEAVAQHRTNIWDELKKEPQCLVSTLSSSPHLEHRDVGDTTMDCVKASTISLTSDVVSLPRDSVPLPSAPPRTDRTRPLESCRETPVATDTQTTVDAAAPNLASAKAVTCPESIQAFEALAQRRCKHQAFQQWCSALRHRWQSRIAVAYIREKVSDGAVAHLRSPSWGGLLAQVTYVERKRGLFSLWWRQTKLRQDLRSRQLRKVWNLWHQKSTKSTLLRLRCRQTCAGIARHMLGATFRTWKAKAEKRASERCTAARRRIWADLPQTKGVPFTPAPHTQVMGHLDAHTSSPRITVVRHTLADALTPSRVTCAAASPIVTSVWRPSTACEGRTRWPCAPSSVTKNETRDACSAPSSSDEEAGLSAVEAPPSTGVSTTSGAITPFIWPTASTEGQKSPQPLCNPTAAHVQLSGLTHEPTPPPAMRMLFSPELKQQCPRLTQCTEPADTATVPTLVPSPSLWNHRSALAPVEQATVGPAPQFNHISSCDQGSLKPRRALFSIAARRAIVQASSTTEKRMTTLSRVESPYPEADVEALVEHAKQLETDRDYLLETLRYLHLSHEKQCTQTKPQPSHAAYRVDPLPLRSSAAPALSCTDVEQLKRQCAAQEREVHRLGKLVAALQDERHQFLDIMKSGLFRY
ncbi:hypothetical protein JKF63_01910 [Porcisia hertigi]|uniref:Uncharacterized protein n=1 Tax=Porcisia hertigi TaxID=2761500 RepID=A0A836L0I6_9TRYP|nr:hypothetical protein JKF63_01910 [Porcisia hertigi]